MPGDEFRTVQPGDALDIPARAYNAFLRNLRDAEATALSIARRARQAWRNPGIVRVRNQTGAAQDRFSCLAVDPPVFDDTDNLTEFQNRATLDAITPTSSVEHLGRFVVLKEPIAAGKIGWAVIDGLTPAQVYCRSTYHGFADVTNGVTAGLHSAEWGGAQILWPLEAARVVDTWQWALVRLGNRPPLPLARVEITAEKTIGESCLAHWIGYVAGGPAGGYTDDPQEGASQITVYDPQGRFAKMATADGDGGAMGWVQYKADSNRWELVTMATPAPFFGTLDGTLTQSDDSQTVTCTEIFGAYDCFQENWVDDNGGAKITAWNPAGGGNYADYWHAGGSGDAVFCVWSNEMKCYWIVAVEPNTQDWQSLQVSVPGGTRTIQLPPQTTIGNP